MLPSPHRGTHRGVCRTRFSKVLPADSARQIRPRLEKRSRLARLRWAGLGLGIEADVERPGEPLFAFA